MGYFKVCVSHQLAQITLTKDMEKIEKLGSKFNLPKCVKLPLKLPTVSGKAECVIVMYILNAIGLQPHFFQAPHF